MKVFFSRQIYLYDFHISKLNNLKVIHDFYSQCLTKTLSKTTSNTKLEGVALLRLFRSKTFPTLTNNNS
jgi:hypothetical protein